MRFVVITLLSVGVLGSLRKMTAVDQLAAMTHAELVADLRAFFDEPGDEPYVPFARVAAEPAAPTQEPGNYEDLPDQEPESLSRDDEDEESEEEPMMDAEIDEALDALQFLSMGDIARLVEGIALRELGPRGRVAVGDAEPVADGEPALAPAQGTL